MRIKLVLLLLCLYPTLTAAVELPVGQHTWSAEKQPISIVSTKDCALCGDVTGDGYIQPMDAVAVIQYIFQQGASDPGSCGNADGCGIITISDAMHIINYLFGGWPAPFGCDNTAPCVRPISGQVELGAYPFEIYPGEDSVAIPVYLTTDYGFTAFTLGFHYDSDDIEITSIDITGNGIGWGGGESYHPADNQVLIGGSVDVPNPVDRVLVCRLNAKILQGSPDQQIILDSAFVPPGGEWLIVGLEGERYSPQFLLPCGCGDADRNGAVNISDAVFIITYLFAAGSDPGSCGNADGCGGVTVFDAHYLIRKIFCMGPEPHDCENMSPCPILPGGEVKLQCYPFCWYPSRESLSVGVYVTMPLGVEELVLGFRYDSCAYTMTSINHEGSQVFSPSYISGYTSPDKRECVVSGYSCVSTGALNNALLCRLNFQVPPGNTDLAPWIDIDSAFISPSHEFILVGPGGQHYSPDFVKSDTCCRCGDANGDCSYDISDAVFLIQFIFNFTPVPADCGYQYAMGDANGDGSVDIADPVYLVAFIFLGGAPPLCHQF